MAGYPINPMLQNALARYAGGGGFMRPEMQPQYPVRMPTPVQSPILSGAGMQGMPAQGTAMQPANTNPVFGGQPPIARSPMPVRGTAMRPTGPAVLPTGGMNSLRGYANL